MNRRGFLKALAALPIVGAGISKLLQKREPVFATGGIVDGRLAVIGNGDPHAFVPLSSGRKIAVLPYDGEPWKSQAAMKIRG